MSRKCIRVLTELREELSKRDARQAAAGEGDGEGYAAIGAPDTVNYEELEMSRR